MEEEEEERGGELLIDAELAFFVILFSCFCSGLCALNDPRICRFWLVNCPILRVL